MQAPFPEGNGTPGRSRKRSRGAAGSEENTVAAEKRARAAAPLNPAHSLHAQHDALQHHPVERQPAAQGGLLSKLLQLEGALPEALCK